MKYFLQSLRMLLVFTVLTGIVYPLAFTAFAQTFFPEQAHGSLVSKNHTLIGSKLIAQSFHSPRYFWPRPSAVDFNPLPSGGSNWGPTSKALAEKIAERRQAGLSEEMLFASGSGLDPHISPQAARAQIQRVATARGFDAERLGKLHALVERHIEPRQFGILGQERVNVLGLNLALDEEMQE